MFNQNIILLFIIAVNGGVDAVVDCFDAGIHAEDAPGQIAAFAQTAGNAPSHLHLLSGAHRVRFHWLLLHFCETLSFSNLA